MRAQRARASVTLAYSATSSDACSAGGATLRPGPAVLPAPAASGSESVKAAPAEQASELVAE